MRQETEQNTSNQDVNQSQEIIIQKVQQQIILNPIEIAWRNLNVQATIESNQVLNGKKQKVKQEKVILNNVSGISRPGQFTAILGPSGSGKTTLLNFLSGRLVTKNLTISGELYLNGEGIQSIEDYSDQIAYVMQDDILLATFTPRESFQFMAKLKLPHKSDQERNEIVDNLILELGLQNCQNTYVGNHLIRGISGGERKRTSIGVELLTDPKILYLDEPTTGLDSSTAKIVVNILKQISRRGVNVVSTIHQPSSEIFSLFEEVILIVEGNIIYQGEVQNSVQHFSKLGYQCPKSYNPADYFMKLMSEGGIIAENIDEQVVEEEQVKEDFKNRIQAFVEAYNQDLRDACKIIIKEPVQKSQRHMQSSFYQFYLLLMRALTHQMRNKFELILKTVQSLVFAIVFIIVFNNLGSGFQGIQNRNGASFFITQAQAFSSIMGSIASFSTEKPLYLRERANRAYGSNAYFWGRSLSELPMQIFYPVLFLSITYYSVGLNSSEPSKFFTSVLISILTFWYGSSYGFLISILCPKFEVAMAFVPATIIPLMVLSGFFVTISTVPIFWKIISYISMFRYGYEAQCINEFTGQSYFTPQGEPINPLQIHDFNTTLTQDCIILFSLGLFVRILCVIGLHFISNPKRPKLTVKQLNDQQS
ncbi:hypothetical protein ABPG74_016608 [Tetrahymena malaccensis]